MINHSEITILRNEILCFDDIAEIKDIVLRETAKGNKIAVIIEAFGKVRLRFEVSKEKPRGAAIIRGELFLALFHKLLCELDKAKCVRVIVERIESAKSTVSARRMRLRLPFLIMAS